MNQTVSYSPTDAQIDIQARQVVILFPNRPAINFSLDIPDLRCAGYSPTYTVAELPKPGVRVTMNLTALARD